MIGVIEVFNPFSLIIRMALDGKSIAVKTIAQIVRGVDYFVIGIALFIFCY